MTAPQNNYVTMCGKIISQPNYSHSFLNKDYYNFSLAVLRFSDVADIIPILVTKELLTITPLCCGDFITVNGQFRSFNKMTNGLSALLLNVYAYEIEKVSIQNYRNEIVLRGFICKKPIFRTTPLGRSVCDLIVAVNRTIGSDYIPAIAWSLQAVKSSQFDIGDEVNLLGRIESREYEKTLPDTYVPITKTAYEVSIKEITKI